MKTAMLQLNPVVGDLEGNSRKIALAAQQAFDRGARLALTSELAVTGYPPKDLLLNRDFISRTLDQVRDLARAIPHGLTLIAGAPDFNESPGNPLFNCAFVLSEGQIAARFAKHLLPMYDVFDERRYFEPSLAVNVMQVNGLTLGLTICEDVWNDQGPGPSRLYGDNPMETLGAAGPDLIVNLSASPFSLGKQAFREKLLGELAAKYETPIAYCNQVGGNDDLVFDGASLFVDASGTVRARGKTFEEDIVLVDTDDPAPKRAPHTPAPESEAWSALVLGTRDYARKCGFKKALLGLSGGIDSALTAAVAVEALGRENVMGVLLPSPYSSEGSVTDSLELAENLGIRTQTVPIAPLMKAFDTTLAPIFKDRPADVTEENVQSRIRGNLLMAMSNKFDSLLLTTGNKSELAVGYCTIYGDMSGGLAVISDVPKTLVYAICRWLNEHQEGEIIPQAIIDKAPSAELRPDQKDQDSLPDYDELDAILELMVTDKKSVDRIVEKGFDRATVEKVARLVKIAEFKRQQAAPGLKITDQAFGTGWRMPIAGKW